jgi:hypothetical protein
VSKPFEGSWRGAAGTARCRLGDVGLGGCFVQSLMLPGQGEKLIVTVSFGSHALSFAGQVVYVDPGRGFGVQFAETPEAELAEFVRLLKVLGAGSPAS